MKSYFLPEIQIDEHDKDNGGFLLLFGPFLKIQKPQVDIIVGKMTEFVDNRPSPFPISEVRSLERWFQEQVTQWIIEGIATPMKDYEHLTQDQVLEYIERHSSDPIGK
ncbi:hypothetical protein [Leptospira levettii]|uniref:hypothetical protein n=1 Tax=Leptospira levettii TaxID=2023178 RepID=UPI000C2A2839|nr:hypothetical protein [Leptospira levettii]PJZ87350.1 hypothetical protein CH368_17295 [Leptospira levettii]